MSYLSKTSQNFANATLAARAERAESSREAMPRFSFYRAVGKRSFDILFLLLVCPFVVPVILVLAIVVKFDGGPAFYAQRRVGRNGKVFQFYKLRSMRVNADEFLVKLCQENPEIAAEWETYQKLRHDPRITKVGHFIRKTSLDELPQLLNIFKGDMSFVGPRPFMPSQQVLYEAAKGSAYFKMRPGLTGPWQVSGRGESSFAARVRYDNFYHRKLSFLTDLALILRTFTVVLKSTGH
ncbi:sugar transferase [Celeribacter halophilus]|uniref:Sugar transferase involved in LPS biosynthesis (Colanic, teichoic acid) n=1 Tax=Celeribacter halophilus TaxID=576117 RepID=A0A1I3XHP8_9RHOB|nr:sugar transferase [Celeribacter halophilus]PZX09866.1 lipopolysaccharide/colanic/teichoic acid biosynthesis glycosyltransferase [Celeribacter halophilus]SFK18869.1 Sugar transferase involved in LPS biosynthesis (colanic, teichoic acid) [Celeribacter halophilus]